MDVGEIATDVGEKNRHSVLKGQGDHYRKGFIHRARPFPGIQTLFETLRSFGVLLGVASTCKADELEIYDEQLQIIAAMDAVTCGGHVSAADRLSRASCPLPAGAGHDLASG